jgi:exodeoxyribonuclease VII large subunit
MNTGINQKIYTVSELNAQIKMLLEETYPFVWISGEISNFRRPISGHVYFTLKDDASQIGAVMFRGQQNQLKFEPEDGMSVTGMGRISVYEPRGNYQIILEYMEPSGIGALQIAYEKLKARLAEEGYFDEAHKKPLPFLPQRISIITSPSGAVVHDILKVIHQRFENMAIEIIPVRVQGDGAVEEIVAGLELLNHRGHADLAILARGGGSIEDLQAFNSEPVAKGIFHSQIPVVSAIGHETDFTIADFVADLRAPTPSAAAEMAVPVKMDLNRRCTELTSILYSNINNYINKLQLKLKATSEKLIDPRKKIQDLQLKIDDLTARLNRRISAFLHTRQEHLGWWMDRLSVNKPIDHLDRLNQKLDNLLNNIFKSYEIYYNTNKAKLRELTARLHALSPMGILNRGYSITRTIPHARIVKNSDMVALNRNVEVMLAKGRLLCQVRRKFRDGKKNI